MPSVNPYKPHLIVLPEDQANEEIANGFHLHHDIAYERIRVLPPAGGWHKAVEDFGDEWAASLRRYPERLFVLILDLDGVPTRLADVLTEIPRDLKDRVFALGTLTEPEDLKRNLGSFERIGYKLADDCAKRTSDIWDHELLIHNQAEALRLRIALNHFAFK